MAMTLVSLGWRTPYVVPLALLLVGPLFGGHGNIFVEPSSKLKTYSHISGILRHGARSGQYNQTIQDLQSMSPDMPEYAAKYLDYRWSIMGINESASQREKAVQDVLERGRGSLARYITRFAIEAGDTTLASQFFAERPMNVNDPVLEGDLEYALGNLERAIDLYQGAIDLGKYPHRYGMFGLWPDDVLFSRIAFCHSRLGEVEKANKNWHYAAQFQLTQGLYVEAMVSFLRMGNWSQAKRLVSDEKDMMAQYYPTVFTYIERDNQELSPRHGSHLEVALGALIEGDYKTASEAFAKEEDDSPEKWGLFSISLRERRLDDMADCYSQLDFADPFSLMRRGVLRKNVKRDWLWRSTPIAEDEKTRRDKMKEQALALDGTCNALEAFFGSADLFEPDEYTDTPEMLLNQAKGKLVSCGAVIDYQIAAWIGSSFASSNFESKDEETTFFQEMKQRVVYLEKALAASFVPINIWLKATLLKINAELSISELANYNHARGATLAAGEGQGGGAICVIETSVGSRNSGEPYVQPKPKRNEALRQKREAILADCWQRLESEEGMTTSLVALDLARQEKSGVKERELLAEIFGKESSPCLETRQAEAYEDLNEGTGQRAEELLRQLIQEQSDESPSDDFVQHYQSQLVRALEKQHKYDEALDVLRELKESGYYDSMMGDDSSLLQMAELYQKKGDLARAKEYFLELSQVSALDEVSGWKLYGFIGLGDMELEEGNLDGALREFYRGIQVAKDHLDESIGQEDTLWSNAVSGLVRTWMGGGDSLLKHGFPEKALDFYEQCQSASETENDFWNVHFKEGFEKRIAKKIDDAVKKMNSPSQEE